MITFHALHGKTNHCSLFLCHTLMFSFSVSMLGWHVAASLIHLQSSTALFDLVLLAVLLRCSGWVPGSMATGLSFSSLTLHGDPRVLSVSASVSVSGICSAEDDELAAANICFGLKEGRINILLSEFSLVTGGLSGDFPEFCCKTKFVFFFQFWHFSIKKVEMDGLERDT